MGVLSQGGSRVISLFLPFGPTSAVLRAYASEASKGASRPETKSENEGPALSLSAKVVARTRGLVVGRSSVVVAKVREYVEVVVVLGRKTLKGEDQGWPLRQRCRGTAAAMMVGKEKEKEKER